MAQPEYFTAFLALTGATAITLAQLATLEAGGGYILANGTLTAA